MDGGSWFYVLVVWEGDHVDNIGLGFGDLPDFLQPSALAQSVGQPETIEVAFLSTDLDDVYQYEVLFRYPSIRSAFRYSGWLDTAQRAEMCIDPSEDLLVRIDLYAPRETGEYVRYPSGPPYATTMEALGLSESDFFRILTEEGECTLLPEDLLP